jgi:hypothetical protein
MFGRVLLLRGAGYKDIGRTRGCRAALDGERVSVRRASARVAPLGVCVVVVISTAVRGRRGVLGGSTQTGPHGGHDVVGLSPNI